MPRSAKRRVLCSLGVFAASVLASNPVMAACTFLGVPTGPVVVATPLVLGLYNAASATGTAANGLITISCIVGTLPDFTIALSAGASGNFAPRTMTGGASVLNYNLYTTGSFASVWGDGSGGSITQTYPGGGILTTFNIHGNIPTGQYVTTGLYTDSITVTVTY